MAKQRLYGGSGLFNDRPPNPYSSKAPDAVVGIAGQYQGQPTLGDLFGAQTLAPLPNIVQDNTVRSGGTAFYERMNSPLAPAVENALVPSKTTQKSAASKPADSSNMDGLAGIFAGNTPVAIGQTAKSVMAVEKPGSAVMKPSPMDDDMVFLDKVLEKKFGYEKRGASIRQGMGNADQANAFLYGLGNRMMGLG